MPGSLPPRLKLPAPLPLREGSPFGKKPGFVLLSSSLEKRLSGGLPSDLVIPGSDFRAEADLGALLISGLSPPRGLILLELSLSDKGVSLALSRPSLSESVSEPRCRSLFGITSKSELSLRVSLSSLRLSAPGGTWSLRGLLSL